jgi:transposase InsO family protein
MWLWCQDCGRPSSPEAKGWRLYRIDVPEEDDEPTLAAYCAVCAYVEFPSFEHAEHEVLHWIGFYNAERLHEALGDLPPAEYEHLKYQDRQPPMLSARSQSLQRTQGRSLPVSPR